MFKKMMSVLLGKPLAVDGELCDSADAGRSGRTCSTRGHKWVLQAKVPASIDSPQSYDEDHNLIPRYFEAPFRDGYAWACSRPGCKQWGFLSQHLSFSRIPKARQRRAIYGAYSDFKPGEDSSYARAHSSGVLF